MHNVEIGLKPMVPTLNPVRDARLRLRRVRDRSMEFRVTEGFAARSHRLELKDGDGDEAQTSVSAASSASIRRGTGIHRLSLVQWSQKRLPNRLKPACPCGEPGRRGALFFSSGGPLFQGREEADRTQRPGAMTTAVLVQFGDLTSPDFRGSRGTMTGKTSGKEEELGGFSFMHILRAAEARQSPMIRQTANKRGP